MQETEEIHSKHRLQRKKVLRLQQYRTREAVREEPDVFLKAEQGKHSEVAVNLKNPTRDWTERTAEVFSRESERL